MARRKIARTAKFDKELDQLSKKYKGSRERVESFLESLVQGSQPANKDQIPGLDGKPVYKVRLPLPGIGKRGGARIIYYCDDSHVFALRIFAKPGIEDLPTSDIKQALLSADL